MREDGKTLKKIAAERGITIEEVIADAVTRANGNVDQGAALLGFYRSTFYGWLGRNGKKIRLTAQVVPVDEVEPVHE